MDDWVICHALSRQVLLDSRPAVHHSQLTRGALDEFRREVAKARGEGGGGEDAIVDAVKKLEESDAKLSKQTGFNRFAKSFSVAAAKAKIANTAISSLKDTLLDFSDVAKRQVSLAIVEMTRELAKFKELSEERIRVAVDTAQIEEMQQTLLQVEEHPPTAPPGLAL